MITRAERDQELLKRKRRKNAYVYAVIFLVSILLLIGVFEQISKTLFSPIKLLSSEHKCTWNGCMYTVSVKNTGDLAHEGYVNLNALVRIDLGEAERFDIVASERLTFSLGSGEERKIEGYLKTSVKASRFTVNVGQSKK